MTTIRAHVMRLAHFTTVAALNQVEWLPGHRGHADDHGGWTSVFSWAEGAFDNSCFYITHYSQQGLPIGRLASLLEARGLYGLAVSLSRNLQQDYILPIEIGSDTKNRLKSVRSG